MSTPRSLWSDDRAEGLTEYAVVVGGIVFAAVVTFIALGSKLRGYFTSMQTEINRVPTG